MISLPYKYNSKYMQVEDQNGCLIANMVPGSGVDEHGEFFARACNSHYDLLAALEELLPFAVSTQTQLPSERIAYTKAWDKARAAIAKAEK